MNEERGDGVVVIDVADLLPIFERSQRIEEGPHGYWHWYDRGFRNKLTTPDERRFHWHAHLVGARGRFLVDLARWLGIVHKHGSPCPDCGKTYLHDWPYIAIHWPKVWRLWKILCPAHVLGRMAMWHVLEFVKFDRRARRKMARENER